MMKLKKHNPTRDILMAALLAFLIRPALHLSAKRQQESVATKGEFSIHEPAKDVVQSFEVTKRQLEQTISLAKQKNISDAIDRLKDLNMSLETIENRYTNNSPALLFLGPFASISIVLKEMEIEQELALILQELNEILQILSGKTFEIQNSNAKNNIEEIKICLKENQLLLKKFAISCPQCA